MGRLKEILLTQYIGAIVVAFLTAQGVIGLISCVLMPLGVYLGSWAQVRSVLDASPRQFDFPWEALISTLASTFLHFLAAYALFWWLFWKKAETASPAEEDAAETDADLETS